MNSDIIYAKTASGEEAMHQRTRVMQRNVRMVLILVDGQSTVSDLTLKTGNQQLTENALRELEKGGFVEPLVEQDSLWAEGKKVAQEIRSAAIDKALQFSSSRAKAVSQAPEPSMPEPPISIHSAFHIAPRSDSSISQYSLSPTQPGRVSADPDHPVFTQDGTKKSFHKQLRTAEESKPSFFERVKALLARSDTVSIKPIRRGPRNSMGWPLIVMLSIIGVLVLAFLTVKFFPYESYLPELEADFGRATGRPVKVGTMRVDVYPKPGLLLGDVRIGSGKDEISIVEMRLLPQIATLTDTRKILREVVISGVTFSAPLIGVLPSVISAVATPTAVVGVEHISFEKADVIFGGLGFYGMEGEAKLSSEGLLQSLLLHSPERNLTLEAKPLAKRLDVSLEGLGWRAVQGSPFLFDSINLKGYIENGAFTISTMDLRLFDGLIHGVAVLRADQKPSISGDISFERVNAARFGGALGLEKQFTGEAAGKIGFSAVADSWSTIFSGLTADGEFTLRRGSIRGIDLAETVRRVSGAPVQGGTTLFEQLSGKIKLTPTSSQFPGLVLNSGLMQSTGRIEVSKDLNVNGTMELQMRGTVNQTRVPISISGPLKTPIVKVGKGG